MCDNKTNLTGHLYSVHTVSVVECTSAHITVTQLSRWGGAIFTCLFHGGDTFPNRASFQIKAVSSARQLLTDTNLPPLVTLSLCLPSRRSIPYVQMATLLLLIGATATLGANVHIRKIMDGHEVCMDYFEATGSSPVLMAACVDGKATQQFEYNTSTTFIRLGGNPVCEEG